MCHTGSVLSIKSPITHFTYISLSIHIKTVLWVSPLNPLRMVLTCIMEFLPPSLLLYRHLIIWLAGNTQEIMEPVTRNITSHLLFYSSVFRKIREIVQVWEGAVSLQYDTMDYQDNFNTHTKKLYRSLEILWFIYCETSKTVSGDACLSRDAL